MHEGGSETPLFVDDFSEIKALNLHTECNPHFQK